MFTERELVVGEFPNPHGSPDKVGSGVVLLGYVTGSFTCTPLVK